MADADTHSKALSINLDSKIYGTFAEIGAGQEVARWFLQVGGAAGTVAKTISAYDMTISDVIYGEGSRYVSRDRLLAMLDYEYGLLPERLEELRGADTRFFALADTVAARNYAGTNECHGWMGIRFQASPRSEPNQILLHVNMMDPTNLAQQRALGILGVNLVHASFFRRESVEQLINSLQDALALERIEIDVIELSGSVFGEPDPTGLGVRLVAGGHANAVLFRDDGLLVPASGLLRKRPLVIGRSLFDRTGLELHDRMLEAGAEHLRAEASFDREPLSIRELSLLTSLGHDAPSEEEALSRLHGAPFRGSPTLLTRFAEGHHLTGYLRRYTLEPLRFVLSASMLVQLLTAAHHSDLIGGRLEGLGRLLAENVRIYVYPMEASAFRSNLEQAGHTSALDIAQQTGEVTAESIRLPSPLSHLYEYLYKSDWIVGVERDSLAKG